LSQVLRALRAAALAAMPAVVPLVQGDSRQDVAELRAWDAEVLALPGVGQVAAQEAAAASGGCWRAAAELRAALASAAAAGWGAGLETDAVPATADARHGYRQGVAERLAAAKQGVAVDPLDVVGAPVVDRGVVAVVVCPVDPVLRYSVGLVLKCGLPAVHHGRLQLADG